MGNHEFHTLDMDADRALFEGEIEGLIVTCYENERPLSGLAGLLDWRFHGAISRYIRNGVVTGKRGECVYLPITKNNRLFHLLLVGAGQSSNVGKRDGMGTETTKVLLKNLLSLKLPKLGLSKRDLGYTSEDVLAKNFKGVPLWIAN